MSGADLARELLGVARVDLQALEHMLDLEAFDDAVFGFHAQQAVEKTLKAWINLTGHTHTFTHDLSQLLSELDRYGENIESYWELLDLSAYAVRFRYEARLEGEDPLDRPRLAAVVHGLVEHVNGLLGDTPNKAG